MADRQRLHDLERVARMGDDLDTLWLFEVIAELRSDLAALLDAQPACQQTSAAGECIRIATRYDPRSMTGCFACDKCGPAFPELASARLTRRLRPDG